MNNKFKINIFVIRVFFILLPILSFAQSENKTIYLANGYLNRLCPGGTGFCHGSQLKTSNTKTEATINKTKDNKLQITITKSGFSAKEWRELQLNKVFPIDENASISVDDTILYSLNMNTAKNRIVEKNYIIIFGRDNATFELELQ